jgi:hypothetical protein
VNIDWLAVWQRVRPVLVEILLKVLIPMVAAGGGMAVYGECCLKPAVQQAVAAQK